MLVNERMQDLTGVANKRPVRPGNHIELTDGLQLLCSKEAGGRLFLVQLVNG